MTTATLRYQKRWRAERRRGLTRTVPAAPVAAHLQRLLGGEASRRGIGEVSGVPATVVARIATGRQRTVTRRVADALLDVTTSDLTRRDNPAGFVPKVGAVRRIRALQAIGHCARDIAAATAALTERDVYLIANQAGRWITQARWDAIAQAYDRLSMTPGGSTQARTIAAAAGYPPPLAWDEDAIDEVTATPVEVAEDLYDLDEVAVEALMAGRRPYGLRAAEKAEAVRRLAGQGWSDQRISRQIGACERTVVRLRRRHGIESRWGV